MLVADDTHDHSATVRQLAARGSVTVVGRAPPDDWHRTRDARRATPSAGQCTMVGVVRDAHTREVEVRMAHARRRKRDEAEGVEGGQRGRERSWGWGWGYGRAPCTLPMAVVEPKPRDEGAPLMP
jgi:hypothetical protein